MIMQRYHVFEWDVKMATEPFVDEVLAWIGGEADAEESRKNSGVKPGEEDIRIQARNAGLLLPEESRERSARR